MDYRIKFLILPFICLFLIACSDDDEFKITENESLKVYSNLKMAGKGYYSYFSTELNQFYGVDDLTEDDISKIDLVYQWLKHIDKNEIYLEFLCPVSDPLSGITYDDSPYDFDISYLTDESLTNGYFESIEKGEQLNNGLVFKDRQELVFAFSSDWTPPTFFMFRNAAGKKGIVRIKSISINNVVFDIKIQK